MGITDDLLDINAEVCRELWRVVDIQGGRVGALTPKLVLPSIANRKHNQKVNIRVSEQEARFIYASVLARAGQYFFSVETPTRNQNKSRSALFDMVLWTFENRFKRQANLEFKAGNPVPSHIEKDIKKLIAGGLNDGSAGNWFHLLKNVDSGTLPSLFSKFQTAFQTAFAATHNSASMGPLVFCFCVLEKSWAIQKVFTLQGDPTDYCRQFFNINYQVSKGRVTVKNPQGWHQVLP